MTMIMKCPSKQGMAIHMPQTALQHQVQTAETGTTTLGQHEILNYLSSKVSVQDKHYLHLAITS
jgi:hypothetical protein